MIVPGEFKLYITIVFVNNIIYLLSFYLWLIFPY